jgi:hypothetical protein
MISLHNTILILQKTQVIRVFCRYRNHALEAFSHFVASAAAARRLRIPALGFQDDDGVLDAAARPGTSFAIFFSALSRPE